MSDDSKCSTCSSSSSDEYSTTSDEFVFDYCMLSSERTAILDLLKSDNYRKLAEKAKKLRIRVRKNAKTSEESRSKARWLLNREHHDENLHEAALRKCSTSLAQAPKGSRAFVRALAERARLLQHLNRFKESARDIEEGLKLVGPGSSWLRVELLARLAQVTPGCKCWHFPEGKGRAALDKAFHWYAQLSDDAKDSREADAEDRISLADMLKVAQEALEREEPFECEPYKERDNDFKRRSTSKVQLGYSEKYGRHLLANKDLVPGDIVFYENFDVAVPNLDKSYGVCDHCLMSSWALIPCDECDISMYCSKKCKNKAWRQYHDIECSVLTYLMQIDKDADIYVRLGLRYLLKAFNTEGSIDELKWMLSDVNPEDCKKMTINKLYGNTMTYIRLYGLTSPNLFNYSDSLTYSTVFAVIALIKYSSMFENIDYMNGKNLSENDNVIFIASLLLKYMKLSHTCSTKYADEENFKFLNKEFDVVTPQDNVHKGIVLSSLCSFINHSCNPNVIKLCGNNGKLIYICISPIKKNDQIFESYCEPFYKAPKSHRRHILRDDYEFTCYCKACEKNWNASGWNVSELFNDMNEASEKDKEVNSILNMAEAAVALFVSDSSQFQMKIDCRHCVGNSLQKLYEKLPFPSSIIVFFIHLLQLGFKNTMGCTKLDIPEKCKNTPC